MTDNMEKSNFNPQMLKACTNTSYECGYQQGRADAIEEMFSKIDKLTVYYAGDKDGNAITPKMLVKEGVIKLLEQLKSQDSMK